MRLTPRYGGSPLFEIEGAADDALVPLARQRRRLAATLATLADDRWDEPSRCEAWSVRDVVAHLVTTDTFWHASVAAGLKGEPTTLLSSFDPAVTPAQLIGDLRDRPPADLLDRLVASSTGLLDTLADLDEAGWAAIGESPPGHVPIRLVCYHALWDGWVHERDILLPLGMTPAVEPDEVTICLRYAAVLGPALAVMGDTEHPGVLAVAARDPDVSFVVEVADPVVVRPVDADADAVPVCLRGGAVELVEALSVRVPLPASTPEPWSRLLHAGLATVFDAGAG